MKTMPIKTDSERLQLLDLSKDCINENELQKILNEPLPFFAIYEEEMIWLNDSKNIKPYFEDFSQFREWFKCN